MFLRRSFNHRAVRAGLFSHVSGPSGPSSREPFNSLLCNTNQQMFHSLLGYPLDPIAPVLHDNVGPSLFGRSGVRLCSMKLKESVSLPCAMSIRSFIHSGEPKKFEGGRDTRNSDFSRGVFDRSGNSDFSRDTRNSDFNRGIFDRGGRNFLEGFQFSKYNVEQNADIVHVKMLRNNTFVTVTDSKGNTKFGLSAGKLTDKGGKVSRYAAEACAEQAGRYARDKGIKSVVVKVNGFTYFKKKKQAILGLKEGYSHSRGDKHPIVYIEDTTRRPHNGCRLRKKRRV